MISIDLKFNDDELLQELRRLSMSVGERLVLLGELIGLEVISYLRSLTTNSRPPVRKGEPSRRAHPGGWADITGTLALGYRFEVLADGKKVRWSTAQAPGDDPGRINVLRASLPDAPISTVEIVFINGTEYAAALESHDGYWVLSGIEDPGGPIEPAIRRAVSIVAPEWRID